MKEKIFPLRRIGDSLGIIIPNKVIGDYNLKMGDIIQIIPQFKNINEELSKGRFRLGDTYYRDGFFNTNKTFPLFPCGEDYKNISVILCLGDKLNKIKATVKYKGHNGKGKWINNNHKPRIYGCVVLAKWFQKNFTIGDSIEIIQLHDNQYLLKK